MSQKAKKGLYDLPKGGLKKKKMLAISFFKKSHFTPGVYRNKDVPWNLGLAFQNVHTLEQLSLWDILELEIQLRNLGE